VSPYASALAELIVLSQESVHGPRAAEVLLLFEEDRDDRLRGSVDEALGVEDVEDLGALGMRERARGTRTWAGRHA